MAGRAKALLGDLYKSKELNFAAFNEEEVLTCAGDMLAHMMKHDPQKAEGYKLVLLLCLKILENQKDGQPKLITSIIKPVSLFRQP